MQPAVVTTALLATVAGFVAGLAGGRWAIGRFGRPAHAPAGPSARSPVACVTVVRSDAASLTVVAAGLGVCLRACYVEEDARWYEVGADGALRTLSVAALPAGVVSALAAVRDEWELELAQRAGEA
jgi:hypothetical protein